MTPLVELRAAVEAAAAAVAGARGLPPLGEERPSPRLDRSSKADFGDYSTNAAMLLAPAVGEAPRAVAERLGVELEQRLAGRLARAEVAGPGFLNLFLADRWFVESLAQVLGAGNGYGGGGTTVPQRIDIEFVSANPTGPLTVAHGRHAAYGDALGRILAFAGHDVTREFYVNDYGSQVRQLGETIQALARGRQAPEDGYHGDYVRNLVDLEWAAGADVDDVAQAGMAACLALIRATLERFGVGFDVWFSERSLHQPAPQGTRADGPSALARAFQALEATGSLYRSEGALWLRTAAHGDDKDRVLERSSGEPTYFASDIAYHLGKLDRGFSRLIDVWGADHHGYVKRMQAALVALGVAPEALELIILQFVHLIRRGARSSMSKRRGEFVTLDDLIAEIGADAARFFLLARSHETTVDLDLDLAREQSNDNPVYYVQYAHARIASVLLRAGEARVTSALAEVDESGAGARGAGWRELGGGNGSGIGAGLLGAERALVKKLIAFPGEVAEAAERRAPHRIAAYALELAQEFTAFYRDCRVVGAEPHEVESFRLALSVATQATIARALGLLGVSAPQSM